MSKNQYPLQELHLHIHSWAAAHTRVAFAPLKRLLRDPAFSLHTTEQNWQTAQSMRDEMCLSIKLPGVSPLLPSFDIKRLLIKDLPINSLASTFGYLPRSFLQTSMAGSSWSWTQSRISYCGEERREKKTILSNSVHLSKRTFYHINIIMAQ